MNMDYILEPHAPRGRDRYAEGCEAAKKDCELRIADLQSEVDWWRKNGISQDYHDAVIRARQEIIADLRARIEALCTTKESE